ncbi:MAG: hypothetical protein V4697_02965 [Patescibacteria group bacterium]
MKKIFVITLLALSILTPGAFLLAQSNTPVAPKLDYSGFVNCDGVITKGEEGRKTKCDFAALIALVQKMINWLFYISIPVATVLFAYAGLLYLSGQKGKIDTAKAIFLSVAIGFIIMLVAWFAVSTILRWFASPDSGATTLIGTK